MSQLSPPKSPLFPPQSLPLRFTQQPLAWLYAFWKFARPHTIIGTSLSVFGLYLMTLAIVYSQLQTSSLQQNWHVLLSTIHHPLLVLLTCLCGNVYIVGLNQLQDVEIDRINKPHLPIASGEFSDRQGWWIIGITGILALVTSALQSYFLMATVWLSLLIGTAYSLPPIRLKRSPVWASLCILGVRGAIVNLGFFLHFRAVISRQMGLTQAGQIPLTVWALTLFVIVFTFAIAIFKDIPDAEGDRRYQIKTFTLHLGQRSVFNLARWVITACYGAMILAGALLPGMQSVLLVMMHLIALVSFWSLSFRVDLHDKRSIARFYQFIWKLFFLEYLLFPIVCFTLR